MGLKIYNTTAGYNGARTVLTCVRCFFILFPKIDFLETYYVENFQGFFVI